VREIQLGEWRVGENGGEYKMNSPDEDIKFAIFLSAVGMFFGIIIGCVIWGDNYQRGQIDALTGTVKYELVDQKNGERKWELKK